MRSRSSLVSQIQQLLTGEDADPRAAQAVFLVPVVVELMLRAVSPGGLDSYTAYGSVIALVPSIGSLSISTGRLSCRWTVLLPVLDMVALSVYRLSENTAIGVAVAFPAIWLGLQFGRRGVAIAVVTVLGAFVLPTLISFGLTLSAFSQVSQLTLMTFICSAAVAMTTELWKDEVGRTSRSASRLEEAMAELIEQRRLTWTIVNGVDVGLVALDATGAYDTVNPRHQGFMDLAYPCGRSGMAGEAGFIFGEDGVTLLSSEDKPTSRAIKGEAFRDYLIWVGERPAERRALAVSSTPYLRTDGAFGGAVLAYHDITELMQASRIKDEFVASVSHELRTPLTSIIGYVDIILEDTVGLPDDVRNYLVTVQRNSRRLHRLVDDLLSTVLESVATVLDVERVSLTELLRRSTQEATQAAFAAGLSLQFRSCGETDLMVDGDAERLAQVLDNLLSNAIKYTPSGGSIEVALLQDERDVVVRVCDTGRGISPSELNEIFTKFFRSSTVQSGAIPGVGLGLAITKTIVDAHAGQITVTSELGRGTTFEVRLPLAESPARAVH